MDGSENFQTMNRNTQKVQGSMGEASARCQSEEETTGYADGRPKLASLLLLHCSGLNVIGKSILCDGVARERIIGVEILRVCEILTSLVCDHRSTLVLSFGNAIGGC